MLKKVLSKSTSNAKITFTLPTQAIAGAKEVRVLGEFNNWDWEKAPKMKVSKTNYTATIALSAGKQYQFRYLADNGIWENDWAADNYVAAPYTNVDNSVVAIPAVKGKATAKADTTAKPKKAVAKKVATKKAVTTATSKKAVTKKVATKKAVTIATPKKAVAKKVTAKKAVKADDLKKIEGIGPKIAGLLNADGIITFADLSKTPIKQLRKVLENAGSRFRMHDPKTWAAQAKLAAKGSWVELTKWQGELKGGK